MRASRRNRSFSRSLAFSSARKKLQRNSSVEALIARAVHDPHATRSRNGKHPVIASNEIALREACLQHRHRPTSTRSLSRKQTRPRKRAGRKLIRVAGLAIILELSTVRWSSSVACLRPVPPSRYSCRLQPKGRRESNRWWLTLNPEITTQYTVARICCPTSNFRIGPPHYQNQSILNSDHFIDGGRR